MLTGSNTRQEALEIQNQIIHLLKTGGFNLRKWTSNRPSLLENLPEESRELGDWEFKPDATIKTLGITWSPQQDTLQIIAQN